ncbi:hypothetical protein V6N13_032521 [Hibiscus sabdariffa]|uniref:Uncharacterized protein n=2 Tax=Hibiscus sabdariffa TaxID=183260 RepID=A0ABR2AV80_9ROSI
MEEAENKPRRDGHVKESNTYNRKRKLSASPNDDVQDSYFKIRLLLQHLRPHFIQAINTHTLSFSVQYSAPLSGIFIAFLSWISFTGSICFRSSFSLFVVSCSASRVSIENNSGFEVLCLIA